MLNMKDSFIILLVYFSEGFSCSTGIVFSMSNDTSVFAPQQFDLIRL